MSPKESLEEERSDDLSQDAGARADEGDGVDGDAAALSSAFDALVAVYPASGLQRTDFERALVVFMGLASGLADPMVLVACARRYAESDALRRGDFGACSLQRWLSEGRWRAFMPEAPAIQARARFADEAVRAAVVAIEGEAFAVSYLDPSGWDPEPRVVQPRTGMAWARLRPALPRLPIPPVTLSPRVLQES